MASAYSTVVDWENLRSLPYTSMADTFVGIGTPFANPIRILSIYNSTDEDLFLSNDGVNDKIVIPAHSEQVYDIGANRSSQGGWLVLSAGRRLYVRYPASAPTQGAVYVEVIYGTDAIGG
jgi:hypothetical protein